MRRNLPWTFFATAPQARSEAEALRDALRERTTQAARRERARDEELARQRAALEAAGRELEQRRQANNLELHVSCDA